MRTVRTLWRDRAFSSIAIAMFALGIGATTVIFSLVNGILLRPLSHPEPGRLYGVYQHIPEVADTWGRLLVNGRHFDEWRRTCDACESLGLFRYDAPSLTGDGPPARIDGLLVTHDFLTALGAKPILGRTFLPSDDIPGAEPVVLVTGSFWRERYAADPEILGKRITIDGKPMTVIGVLPESFRFETGSLHEAVFAHVPRRFQVVRPLRLSFEALPLDGQFNFGAIVRLKPDAPAEQAMAQMDATLAELTGPLGIEVFARMVPLTEAVVGKARAGLWMLLAAVVAVLLIVCVNLSNLILVRSARRAKDVAVRLAMGASRRRLIAGLVGEIFVLALAGGWLGLLLGQWATSGLAAWAPPDIPRLDEVRLDWTAFMFSLFASTCAALLAAALPALRMVHSSIEGVMRANQTSHTGARANARSRSALVAAEVALSSVLLVVAGLLATSFSRLMAVEKGFDSESVISFHVLLPNTDYRSTEERLAFYEELLAALKARPGVLQAGLTNKLPLDGTGWGDVVGTPGRPGTYPDALPVDFRFISPGYFRAAGLALREGRLLEPQDQNRQVVLASESLARAVWPGESAIGKRMRRGASEQRPLMEVVGVVSDVPSVALDADIVPIAYEPYWNNVGRGSRFVVRTSSNPRAFTDDIRQIVQRIDPGLPVADFRTLEQVVAESASRERFQTLLAGAFAVTALLLACLGIYGVVSYAVAGRTNEVGIRMALGARSASVLSMVLGQSIRPVVVGLAVGLVAAFVLVSRIEAMLFEVTARDPLVFAAVALVLLGVGLAACFVPARRASRIEPLQALRYE